MLGNSTAETSTNASSQKKPWCKLAYWELRNRVGRLFEVNSTRIDVFSNNPHGNGLCLSEIRHPNHQNDSAPNYQHRPNEQPTNYPATSKAEAESVIRTREKIGCGITISREESGVRIYNRSSHAIFVNSSTLDPPNTRNLTVFKVPPGKSIKAFDYDIAKKHRKVQKTSPPDGPVDHNSIRISFVKGWGQGYSRQFIESCPCWLEVLLVIMR